MAEPQQQQPINLDALIDAAAAGRPQAQTPASNELDMLIEMLAPPDSARLRRSRW